MRKLLRLLVNIIEPMRGFVTHMKPAAAVLYSWMMTPPFSVSFFFSASYLGSWWPQRVS